MLPCGNGVPATTTNAAELEHRALEVSSGNRKAAANVTTPRMPAHETTAPVDRLHDRARMRAVPA